MAGVLTGLDKKAPEKSAGSDWSAMVLTGTDHVVGKVGWSLHGGYEFRLPNAHDGRRSTERCQGWVSPSSVGTLCVACAFNAAAVSAASDLRSSNMQVVRSPSESPNGTYECTP